MSKAKSDQALARGILGRLASGEQYNGVEFHEKGLRVPAKIKLLGSSVKVEKGRKVGILTAILYLAPANSAPIARNGSRVNLCPSASAGCRAGCLGEHAGRMVQSGVRNARNWKTTLYFAHPALFGRILSRELKALQRRGKRLGMPVAVRLDGTSDLGLADRYRFPSEFPSIMFYDYTKVATRVQEGDYRPNRHYTYSASERPESATVVEQALAAGHSVAAIVSSLPKTGAEWRKLLKSVGGKDRPTTVIDGDETDARFLDTSRPLIGENGQVTHRFRGALVALSVKGGKRVHEKLGSMVFEV